MNDPRRALQKTTRQVTSFGLIGGLGALTNAGAYAACIFLGMQYLVALAIAWGASTLQGYLLNRKFTFQSSTPVRRSLPRVVAVYVAQQGITAGGISVLVERFGVGQFPAYLVMVGPAVLFSFLAMRFFAFAPPQRAQT
jgi:putative flippase GtrA